MDSSFDYVFCMICAVSAVRQKAQTVLWYGKFEFITWVHHEFRREYSVRPPDDKIIRRWYEQVWETGSVGHSTGQTRRPDEDMDLVRQAFILILKKSISKASAQLHMLQRSVHRILRNSLRLKPYKLQAVQKLTTLDKWLRLQFVAHVHTHFGTR
jgi:hypothetical protein